MTALILHTRALEVVADPKADIGAARRMRDILTAAARMGIPVRVPTAVLAEAYRGIPADAALDRVLGRGIRPVTMGQAMARLAGGLRYRDRLKLMPYRRRPRRRDRDPPWRRYCRDR